MDFCLRGRTPVPARRAGLAIIFTFLCLVALSCRHFGFTKVDEGVYVSGPHPSLTRVGREISTARHEAQGNQATKDRPDLSVTVKASAGLSAEGFRIISDDKNVSVEGGGPAGAFYGGLELARRLREGRPQDALKVGPVEPRLALRVAKTELSLPGLTAQAPPASWLDLLDKVADARFNVLVVTVGNVFPELVKLSRFPKCFTGVDGEGAKRQASFREALQALAERHLQVILTFEDIEAPPSLFKHYGGEALDEDARRSLARTYFRECVAETLKAYPQLRGAGFSPRLLKKLSPAALGDLIRGPLADAVRGAGRGVALWVPHELAGTLGEWKAPTGMEVLLEQRLSLHAPPVALLSSTGMKAVGCVPLELLGSFCPVPEWPAQATGTARARGFAGVAVDLLTARPTSWEIRPETVRASLIASCIGLGTFDPAFDPLTWETLWREAAQEAGPGLSRAARQSASMWAELARLWSRPGWSPLTASEESPRPGDLRDADRFVSILELAFSAPEARDCASIAELVGSERAAGSVPEGKASPLEVAAKVLEHAKGCRSELGGAAAAAVARPEGTKSLLALELEMQAALGCFHAHRIVAATQLLHYVASGKAQDHESAKAEIREARESWNAAARSAAALRKAFPLLDAPDLQALSAQAELDIALVDGALADPFGFACSPLASVPLPTDHDFRTLRGALHLGVGLLNTPPRELFAESQAIEAEDFFGAWSLSTELAGYSGEGYVSSCSSESPSSTPMTLRFKAGTPGTVYVWVRGVTGGGKGSPGFRLRAGKNDMKTTHAADDGPLRFAWVYVGALEIAPGDVLLQILDAGTGKEGVDLIVLSRDRQWVPPAY